MANRILVIPDIHGRNFWKEPVDRYLEQVDRIVFLGDYLDPYENLCDEDIFNNLINIINLKQKHPDKVVLLKGNHDEHYISEIFRQIAAGSRMSYENWEKYHKTYKKHNNLFKFVHLEEVNGRTYLFSHAGLTTYWINKVNSKLWHLMDKDVYVADPRIIDRLNILENTKEGQEMLSVVGKCRSRKGEKTGSLLWADVEEHLITDDPHAYGLDKVYQVFGHTRLNGDTTDKIELDNFAMIDSQKCFIIDENWDNKIVTIEEYEDYPIENHIQKVIFLDIDGVLNTKFWYGQGKKDKYGHLFDPNAVDNLARIIEETGADIVISSSWKSMGLTMLRRMWKDRKLPGKIVGVTPDILCDELLMNEENIDYLYNRGSEIKGWLLQHKDDDIQYVILDDFDDILPEQQSHFIQIDPDVGITNVNAKQAKMIMNRRNEEYNKIY